RGKAAANADPAASAKNSPTESAAAAATAFPAFGPFAETASKPTHPTRPTAERLVFRVISWPNGQPGLRRSSRNGDSSSRDAHQQQRHQCCWWGVRTAATCDNKRSVRGSRGATDAGIGIRKANVMGLCVPATPDALELYSSNAVAALSSLALGTFVHHLGIHGMCACWYACCADGALGAPGHHHAFT
ncbi:hypothetical protein GGI23_007366, partial [Coemansia sp. RSA 2559]